jgi:hypothetical protein
MMAMADDTRQPPAGSDDGIVLARGGRCSARAARPAERREAIVDRNVTVSTTPDGSTVLRRVLASYGIGGWVAGRTAPTRSATAHWPGCRFRPLDSRPHRHLGGPRRAQGLFRAAPVLRPGQMFGHLSSRPPCMLGGWIGSRAAAFDDVRAGTAS